MPPSVLSLISVFDLVYFSFKGLKRKYMAQWKIKYSLFLNGVHYLIWFFYEQNENKCIWFNYNWFLNDVLFAKPGIKIYIFDLSSLSYALPSQLCCTPYSAVALGETQPSATVTCKWKLMTNRKNAQLLSQETKDISGFFYWIIVVLESVSDSKKCDNSLVYWRLLAEFSAVLPKDSDSQGSYSLAHNSASWLVAIISLSQKQVLYLVHKVHPHSGSRYFFTGGLKSWELGDISHKTNSSAKAIIHLYNLN